MRVLKPLFQSRSAKPDPTRRKARCETSDEGRRTRTRREGAQTAVNISTFKDVTAMSSNVER
jgi:hypothetical protein